MSTVEIVNERETTMKTRTKAVLIAFNVTWLFAAGMMLVIPRDNTANSDIAAISACKSAVKSNATYPSKADFYLIGTGAAYSAENDSTLVYGKVDLMNGFGAMIPHQYQCLTRESEIISVYVAPDS